MRLNNISEILSTEKTLLGEAILSYESPWQIFPDLKEYIKLLIRTLPSDYIEAEKDVLISKDAKIDPLARIEGPTIIDKGAEIRYGAYIRGGALIGKGCVVGCSCEIKNSILFDNAKAPHLNYVGDSILGYYAHIGAGVILSNQKSDKSEITIQNGKDKTKTGLIKMGSIIGDFSEIGCGSVLNPGTIIGKNTTVYPLSSVRGYVDSNHIYKSPKNISKKHTRVD